jgi:RNA polymerase sigma factor (sigma-70 family)
MPIMPTSPQDPSARSLPQHFSEAETRDSILEATMAGGTSKYHYYEGPIRRFLESRGLRGADVDDLTQEALIDLARLIDKRDPQRQGSFRWYLQRCVANLANHAARRRGEVPVDPMEGMASAPEIPPPTELALLEAHGRRLLPDLLAGIGRDQRLEGPCQVFSRWFVDGIEQDALLAEFGISERTLRNYRKKVVKILVAELTTRAESPHVQELIRHFAASGDSDAALFSSKALTELFRYRSPEREATLHRIIGFLTADLDEL